MSLFAAVSLGGWLLVVVAASFRSRAYAVFRAVLLGVHSLIACALSPRFGWAFWPALALHGVVHLQALMLVRPRMRSWPYRSLVSIPGAFFSAGTLLAWPWALSRALSIELPWLILPYLFALLGVLESLFTRREVVDLVVRDGYVGEEPRRHESASVRVERPISIVQVTDPHLGPFMSVERLRRVMQRAVERNPDLILLTGDYLTMESQRDPDALARAFEPLLKLPGRVFGCFGNHDHEAPEIVRRAFERAGARLLVDTACTVETPGGRVQLVGFDFRFRGRKAHLEQVCAEHPRLPGALRIALLHDPGAFRHLPVGEADLALSGHTHGGQVGLVTFGLSWTALRLFGKSPDHGFWARGPDRLYVHRGTGHYGFPLRVGVPAEDSMLRVHVAHALPLKVL